MSVLAVPSSRRFRRLLAATASGALLLIVAACGGDEDVAAAPGGESSAIPDTAEVLAGVQADPELAAGLPAEIAERGNLTIGSNLQSAPNNFYAADGTTPVGFEVDLAKAIAAKLGVGVVHQDMAFGSLITSLQSGRVDLTMAAMNDTAERQQQIDFVDYFRSGITIMVKKGNPEGVDGPDALCGKTVAVVQGTSHQEFAAERSAECTRAGREAVSVTATDSDTQNQNQLRTGRVAAILNDLPTAVYVSKTAGDGKFFEVVPGEPINGGPYGIGVNKNNRALADAVSAALRALLEDGTYGSILEAWDVRQGAVEQVDINGGS